MTPICSKCGSGNIIDDIDRDSRITYKKCLMCGRAISETDLQEQKEEEMVRRSPMITPSADVCVRLNDIRTEREVKYIEFVKTCGLSRSQWGCIRNAKPLGKKVLERIAHNLGITYEWLMEGTGQRQADEDILSGPVHDAGYPLPVEKMTDGEETRAALTEDIKEGQLKTTLIEDYERKTYEITGASQEVATVYIVNGIFSSLYYTPIWADESIQLYPKDLEFITKHLSGEIARLTAPAGK